MQPRGAQRCDQRNQTDSGSDSYVAQHREGQGCQAATARRELTVLRAAVNHDYGAGRLTEVRPVWMPPTVAAKDRWLTRDEAARLLRTARANPKARHHLSRFILIGLYTCARSEAILSPRWPQVDPERGLIDFALAGRERTSKGRPPTQTICRAHLKPFGAQQPLKVVTAPKTASIGPVIVLNWLLTT